MFFFPCSFFYFLFISPLPAPGIRLVFPSPLSLFFLCCCCCCCRVLLLGVKAVVWDDWVVDLGSAVQNAAPPSEKPPPPPMSNPPTETHDQIVVHQSTSTTPTSTCSSSTSTTTFTTSINQQVIAITSLPLSVFSFIFFFKNIGEGEKTFNFFHWTHHRYGKFFFLNS